MEEVLEGVSAIDITAGGLSPVDTSHEGDSNIVSQLAGLSGFDDMEYS